MTGFSGIAIGLGQAAAGISRGMVAEDMRLRNLRSQNLEAFARFRELFPDAAPADMIGYREELAGGMNYLRGGLPSDDVIADLSKRQGEKRKREQLQNMAAEEGFKKQIGDMFQERLKSLLLSDERDDKVIEAADQIATEFSDPRGQDLYLKTIKPGLLEQRKNLQQDHAFGILKKLTDLNPDFTDSTVLDGYMPNAPQYVRAFVNQRAANNRLKVERERQALQSAQQQQLLEKQRFDLLKKQDERAADQIVQSRRDSVFAEIGPSFAGMALKGDESFAAYKDAITSAATGKGVAISNEEILARWGALKSGAEGKIFARMADPDYALAVNADVRAGNADYRAADIHPLTVQSMRDTMARGDSAEARAAELHTLNVESMRRQSGLVVANEVARIAESVAKDMAPLAQAGGDVRATYMQNFADRLAAANIDASKLPPGIVDSYFTSMASGAAGTAALADRTAGLAAGGRLDKSYDEERNKVVNEIDREAQAMAELKLGKNHPGTKAIGDVVRAIASEFAITTADASALMGSMSADLGSYAKPEKIEELRSLLRKRVVEAGVPTVAQDKQARIRQEAERYQRPVLSSFSNPGATGTNLVADLSRVEQGIELLAKGVAAGHDPNSPAVKARREVIARAVTELTSRVSAASQAVDANLHAPQVQALIGRVQTLRGLAAQLEQGFAAKAEAVASAPPADAAAADGAAKRGAEATQIIKALDPMRHFRGQPSMENVPSDKLDAMRRSLLADAYTEAKARWARSKSYPMPTEEDLAAALAKAMPGLFRRDQPSTGVAGP